MQRKNTGIFHFHLIGPNPQFDVTGRKQFGSKYDYFNVTTLLFSFFYLATLPGLETTADLTRTATFYFFNKNNDNEDQENNKVNQRLNENYYY